MGDGLLPEVELHRLGVGGVGRGVGGECEAAEIRLCAAVAQQDREREVRDDSAEESNTLLKSVTWPTSQSAMPRWLKASPAMKVSTMVVTLLVSQTSS